jgi:polyisoprenoid-binding protein YceI
LKFNDRIDFCQYFKSERSHSRVLVPAISVRNAGKQRNNGKGGIMKKQLIFVISLIVVLSQITSYASDTYRIDSKQSKLTVEVGTGGLLGFAGHSHHIAVRQLAGEIQASPKSPESASVNIRIVSDSLEETGEFKEKDLNTINTDMKQNVLETSKYPEIAFKSNKVSAKPGAEGQYEVQIEGDLVLHGVTQKVVIPASVTLNEKSLHAIGHLELNRDDYKIETKSAGGGTVKVAKELKISFDIVAVP